MTLHVSRPQEVEAVQWTGDHDSFFEVDEFAERKVFLHYDGALDLLAGKDGAQGWVPVPVGHWLVSLPGDRSDIWPVDPDYFANKYEAKSDLTWELTAEACRKADEAHVQALAPQLRYDCVSCGRVLLPPQKTEEES